MIALSGRYCDDCGAKLNKSLECMSCQKKYPKCKNPNCVHPAPLEIDQNWVCNTCKTKWPRTRYCETEISKLIEFLDKNFQVAVELQALWNYSTKSTPYMRIVGSCTTIACATAAAAIVGKILKKFLIHYYRGKPDTILRLANLICD